MLQRSESVPSGTGDGAAPWLRPLGSTAPMITWSLGEKVAKQPLEEGHLNVFQVAFILSEPIMLNGDTYLQAANIQLIRNHI